MTYGETRQKLEEQIESAIEEAERSGFPLADIAHILATYAISCKEEADDPGMVKLQKHYDAVIYPAMVEEGKRLAKLRVAQKRKKPPAREDKQRV